MREIKFRAWDKKHSQMITELLCFHSCGGISHSNHFNSDNGNFRGYMWNAKDLDVMQYTGLKDKNGIEIYEGDLLKTTKHNSTLDGDIGIVGFKRASFCLMCPEFESNQYVNLCDFGILCNHIEVIGNIYENKEVLNG